jgi:hypothetical protein
MVGPFEPMMVGIAASANVLVVYGLSPFALDL